MKRFRSFLPLLFFACCVSLAQAQPPQKSAPAKVAPRNTGRSVPKPAATSSLRVQQPRFPAPASGYYYTPQGHYYSPAESGTGHYYSPTTSGSGHYYSPTASGGGHYYTPQGHYISGNGSYYTPSPSNYVSASGGSYYSPPMGNYTSGSGSYYTPPTNSYTTASGGSYTSASGNYTSANGNYTTPQGQYTSATGNYYTPQKMTTASPQSQNITPQNQTTPQPAASSSMNTASAADAAAIGASSLFPQSQTAQNTTTYSLSSSPSKAGLDTTIAGSTPQLLTSGNNGTANQLPASCKLPDNTTYIQAAKPLTTDELVRQKELELMHIEPGPNADQEFRDYLKNNPQESMLIAKQAKEEVLGPNYAGPSPSEDAAFTIFSVFDGIELLDFSSGQQTSP